MRRILAVGLLVLGVCSLGHRVAADTTGDSAAAAREAYGDRKAALEKRRLSLGERYAAAKTKRARVRLRKQATQAILASLKQDVLPAWAGTTWDYNGTTQSPGEGAIACGYYVTTVLRDLGFKVERRKLAQQASEWIVRTLSPEASIWRFRKGDRSLVVDGVKEAGEGLYVVGLDNHVGLLLNDGKEVSFCHSSYLEPAAVTCEDPLSSAAFESNYHVVGKLLERPMIESWLAGSAIATKTP